MKQEKHLALAINAHTSGDLKGAESLYRKFLRSNPASHSANNNLGLLLLSAGRAEEAAIFFQNVAKMFPKDQYALVNLGNCYVRQKQFDLALKCYRKSTEDFPGSALAWFNYANCLKDMSHYEESVAAYDRALALDDRNAKAWTNLGIALYKLNRYAEAQRCHEQALSIDPTMVEALVNHATTLLALRQSKEALRSNERALELRPDLAIVWSALAGTMRNLHRYQDAIRAYEKAIALTPEDADVLDNYGGLLSLLKEPKAIFIYQRLVALEPDRKFALGKLISAKRQQCDWSAVEGVTKQWVREGILMGRPLMQPLVLLSQSDSPEEQLAAAKTYLNEMLLPTTTQLKAVDRSGRKLRVAYFSGDLREHAVSGLMRGIFEAHDRDNFETFAISFYEQLDSPFQAHLKTLFDHWLNVEDESDAAVIERMRALQIDIAVDLAGYTENSRTGLFAHRIAPIQVSYLGYPGTMGAEFFDYIIADRYVIPSSEASHYAEKVVYLPDSFQANDSRRAIPKEQCSRVEMGLPEKGFVFCCLNNSYKISPEMFAVWMRLLRAVVGSVLWLLGENETARANLRKAAIDHGVDPERIVFARRRTYNEYLASYSAADLFLDTFPFNAGTTASDALWAGLPVLTCSGRAFASRMAGSLLHAIGLPELIADDLEQYEEKALELARGVQDLAALRERLRGNRLSASLFDSEKFTRYLESAYLRMHELAVRGDNAACIDVARIV